MPRKRTKPAVKQAQTLLDWLLTLELPTRVLGALRRDLEVVIEQWEGELGGGVLAGVDQARFVAELYRDGGGLISRVLSVGPSAIAALRAVIAAPISAEGAPPSPAEAAPAPAEPSSAPVYGEDFVPPPLEDAEPQAPDEAVEEAAALAEAVEPASALPMPAEAAGEAAVPAEAPEAPPTPAEAPPAPVRRRGRPPRVETAPTPAPEPPASAEAPVRRRGRPRRSEAAPVAPAAAPTPAQQARAATAATPSAPEPSLAALSVPDPSTDVLLRLWRELHPQGRQATLHYIKGLLIGE